MFNYNNWVLCDYSEDIIESDDQYIHINYNEKDISILPSGFVLMYIKKNSNLMLQSRI